MCGVTGSNVDDDDSTLQDMTNLQDMTHLQDGKPAGHEQLQDTANFQNTNILTIWKP